MTVESRMDEFTKVADKKPVEDVEKRMSDFEQVDKENIQKEHGESTLPFGLKKYKTCPLCGEFMEIAQIKQNKAIYYCKNCNKQMSQPIE